MSSPVVAFHAPMKPPDHPVPSGDREIARGLLAALEQAGFAPRVVTCFVSREGQGSAEAQARLAAEGGREAERLIDALRSAPPRMWFTYHSYYKAPDLLGPTVAGALGIPYVVAEPSTARSRRVGPWAAFARASDAALARADILFWTTARDRGALEAAGHGPRMVQLPAFLDPGPEPSFAQGQNRPLRLLTVAMMRPGDKRESYRRLARALEHCTQDWRLDIVGTGEAEADIREDFALFGPRVRFLGVVPPPDLRPHYQRADLFVWPGVGEGVGMVWLEAQAAACPVVAERSPVAEEIVAGGCLAAPDSPRTFAQAIGAAASDRRALGRLARRHVVSRHSLDAASALLSDRLGALLA